MRRIFELSASGMGYLKIATTLNREGVKNPAGQDRNNATKRSDQFSASGIKAILGRELYRGKLVYGRTGNRWTPDGRKKERGDRWSRSSGRTCRSSRSRSGGRRISAWQPRTGSTSARRVASSTASRPPASRASTSSARGRAAGRAGRPGAPRRPGDRHRAARRGRPAGGAGGHHQDPARQPRRRSIAWAAGREAPAQTPIEVGPDEVGGWSSSSGRRSWTPRWMWPRPTARCRCARPSASSAAASAGATPDGAPGGTCMEGTAYSGRCQRCNLAVSWPDAGGRLTIEGSGNPAWPLAVPGRSGRGARVEGRRTAVPSTGPLYRPCSSRTEQDSPSATRGLKSASLTGVLSANQRKRANANELLIVGQECPPENPPLPSVLPRAVHSFAAPHRPARPAIVHAGFILGDAALVPALDHLLRGPFLAASERGVHGFHETGPTPIGLLG